jgi:hypothetical protein
MPACRCPNCDRLLPVDSSQFGKEITCDHCRHKFTADTTHLAHFQLPDRIEIHISRRDGSSWTGEPATVLVQRGVSLPPLLTAVDGTLVVTPELFQQAEEDASDFMDRRDSSLVRYLTIVIPTKQDAEEMAERRRTSGWSITPLERRFYGTMNKLLEAYTIGAVARERGVHERVDLAAAGRHTIVRLEL